LLSSIKIKKKSDSSKQEYRDNGGDQHKIKQDSSKKHNSKNLQSISSKTIEKKSSTNGVSKTSTPSKDASKSSIISSKTVQNQDIKSKISTTNTTIKKDQASTNKIIQIEKKVQVMQQKSDSGKKTDITQTKKSGKSSEEG